ncbi:MAG: MmoB/DmpM family protein [Spongiibacteraceae bacterium]
MTDTAKVTENFTVSAKFLGGEEAEIISELMQDLYPSIVVEDFGSYRALTVDGEQLVFDMGEIAEEIGSAYTVTNFLAILVSYKGDIDVGDDSITIKVFAPKPQ